jgi:hypothetical protein
MNLEKFHKDHAEISAIVRRIDGALHSADSNGRIEMLVNEVHELSAKYSVHLALEDGALYPRLARADNVALREIARHFQSEMGQIRARFDDYRHKWPGMTAASADPAGFVSQTKEVINSLKDRFSREESTLYPMAEKAA